MFSLALSFDSAPFETTLKRENICLLIPDTTTAPLKISDLYKKSQKNAEKNFFQVKDMDRLTCIRTRLHSNFDSSLNLIWLRVVSDFQYIQIQWYLFFMQSEILCCCCFFPSPVLYPRVSNNDTEKLNRIYVNKFN